MSNKKIPLKKDDQIITELVNILGYESLDKMKGKVFEIEDLVKRETLKKWIEADMYNRFLLHLSKSKYHNLQKEIKNEKEIVSLFRAICKNVLDLELISTPKYIKENNKRFAKIRYVLIE